MVVVPPAKAARVPVRVGKFRNVKNGMVVIYGSSINHRTGVKVIGRSCSHKRQLEVSVGVNTS